MNDFGSIFRGQSDENSMKFRIRKYVFFHHWIFGVFFQIWLHFGRPRASQTRTKIAQISSKIDQEIDVCLQIVFWSIFGRFWSPRALPDPPHCPQEGGKLEQKSIKDRWFNATQLLPECPDDKICKTSSKNIENLQNLIEKYRKL